MDADQKPPSKMAQEYKGQLYRICFPGGVYNHEPALVFYSEDGSIAYARAATVEEAMAYESKELLRNIDYNIGMLMERISTTLQYPIPVVDSSRR